MVALLLMAIAPIVSVPVAAIAVMPVPIVPVAMTIRRRNRGRDAIGVAIDSLSFAHLSLEILQLSLQARDLRQHLHIAPPLAMTSL